MKLPSGSSLDFTGPALIMAIVNCNDDSFYPSSRALRENAVEKALAAERDGASIIDFGGESSRPGASCISGEEELDRLIPVIEAFRKRSSLPVSVDTRKAAVARAALDAGAGIVNDISALSFDAAMAALCAGRGAAVVLVHGGGVAGKAKDAETQRELPRRRSITGEIRAFFAEAAARAMAAGIPGEKIILDPGIGFGKSTDDNLEILRRFASLAEIRGKHYPVLVGLSRKSFLGGTIEGRLAGTMAANAAAIMNGANIIRVHDVKEHSELVRVLFALKSRT